MISILIHDDVTPKAKAYQHPERIAPAAVHIDFTRVRDIAEARVAYVRVSPDDADRLAGELLEAAAEARRLNSEPAT